MTGTTKITVVVTIDDVIPFEPSRLRAKGQAIRLRRMNRPDTGYVF